MISNLSIRRIYTRVCVFIVTFLVIPFGLVTAIISLNPELAGSLVKNFQAGQPHKPAGFCSGGVMVTIENVAFLRLHAQSTYYDKDCGTLYAAKTTFEAKSDPALQAVGLRTMMYLFPYLDESVQEVRKIIKNFPPDYKSLYDVKSCIWENISSEDIFKIVMTCRRNR